MDEAIAALVQAVENHNTDAVKAILDKEPYLAAATVYHRDHRGEPLLNCVIPEGKAVTDAVLTTARLLIDYGADVNAVGYPPNNEGGTALHHAAWTNQAALAQLFIRAGADTEVRNFDVERALDNAARHGNAESVRALIEAGSPYTLSHVVQAGLLDYASTLLNQKPNAVHECDSEGATPLHLLVGPEAHFEPAMLSLLLNAGADLEARDARGRTALHCAIDSEKPEVLEALMAQPVTVDIFASAALGDQERIRLLLADDPSLAGCTQADGLTPLFYAVRRGHEAIVQMLLELGSNPNVYVERWWMEPTPLHAAAMHGYTTICRLLLEHSADVETRNEHGYTPLLVAARWNHCETVALLLKQGANIQARDTNGVSALDWAAWFGNLPLAQLLVDAGFDVNLKAPEDTWSARTPLHFAAEHGHGEVARFLLESGADRNATNRAGQTAQEVALFFGKASVASLLAD